MTTRRCFSGLILEPPEKVSSWSLRPSLMSLGGLRVAGHVVLKIKQMVPLKPQRSQWFSKKKGNEKTFNWCLTRCLKSGRTKGTPYPKRKLRMRSETVTYTDVPKRYIPRFKTYIPRFKFRHVSPIFQWHPVFDFGKRPEAQCLMKHRLQMEPMMNKWMGKWRFSFCLRGREGKHCNKGRWEWPEEFEQRETIISEECCLWLFVLPHVLWGFFFSSSQTKRKTSFSHSLIHHRLHL